MADREDNQMGFLELEGGGSPDDTTRMIINWVQSKETQTERGSVSHMTIPEIEPEPEEEPAPAPVDEGQLSFDLDFEGEAEQDPEGGDGTGPEAEADTEDAPVAEPENDDAGSETEAEGESEASNSVETASDTVPSGNGDILASIRGRLASIPYDGRIGFVVKHVASFLFLLFVTIQRGPAFFFVGTFELIAIAALTNWLAKINKVAATIVDGILFVLFNFQLGVLFFGNDWFSYQMYSNLKYTEDVGGGMGMFIPALIAVIILAFLPVEHLDLPISDTGIASIALFCELICALTMGNSFSPIFAYFDLARQVQEAESRMSSSVNITPDAAQFFHEGIDGGIERPANMPEHPNVILIFTEGLSQNIVEDERRIMPNVRDYQLRSLSFVNYYNHTAATENGLWGQMYSGWFYPNHLVSIQSIMHDTGYHTVFINTEPNNVEFTHVLEPLGYDELISEPGEYEGAANSLSDRQAYEKLFETATELEQQDQPFFLAIYTFGTHAFIDSPDERFGDGTNPELNKFYNADHWFGWFMEQFESSELFNDTIIVFTADHCTYGDQPYLDAFPDHPRVYNFTDTMPFFIYHQGITPRTYDVSSRTTLCMAPTVLDYLDISAPNYFLGTSLLAYRESDSWIEHYYSDWANTTSTFTNNVEMMGGEDRQRFWDLMAEYTAAREAMPEEKPSDNAAPDADSTLPDAEAEGSADAG